MVDERPMLNHDSIQTAPSTPLRVRAHSISTLIFLRVDLRKLRCLFCLRHTRTNAIIAARMHYLLIKPIDAFRGRVWSVQQTTLSGNSTPHLSYLRTSAVHILVWIVSKWGYDWTLWYLEHALWQSLSTQPAEKAHHHKSRGHVTIQLISKEYQVCGQFEKEEYVLLNTWTRLL